MGYKVEENNMYEIKLVFLKYYLIFLVEFCESMMNCGIFKFRLILKCKLLFIFNIVILFFVFLFLKVILLVS